MDSEETIIHTLSEELWRLVCGRSERLCVDV